MQNWDDDDVASAQSTPTLEETNSKETSPGGREEKVPDQPTVTTPTDSSSEPQVYLSMQELMNQLFTAIVSTESEFSRPGRQLTQKTMFLFNLSSPPSVASVTRRTSWSSS